jgi:hypothetical protein
MGGGAAQRRMSGERRRRTAVLAGAAHRQDMHSMRMAWTNQRASIKHGVFVCWAIPWEPVFQEFLEASVWWTRPPLAWLGWQRP